jgi:FKBP-type peptidyl-prolyl cis-trans isomerase
MPIPARHRRHLGALRVASFTLILSAACTTGGRNAPAAPRTIAALQAIELTEGSGDMAEWHRCVYAHYTGTLLDGTKFDSSRDTTRQGTPREPIAVPLGFRRVITGWDVGFDSLRVGGTRRLIIPHQFAYGPRGRPPVIPPAATLIFDIELMAVRDTLPRAPGTTWPRCAPWREV